MNANQILDEFVSLMHKFGKENNFNVQFWYQGTRRTSNNILALSGSIGCLVYFKVRSDEPYRWGVTKNRIIELNQTGKKWVVVLLYESANTGYIIAGKEIKRYLSVWPLGADGDYKVAPGKYLQFSRHFNSFTEYYDLLKKS